MSSHAPFTLEQARAAGLRIGVDWDTSPFSLEQFRMGMDVELEHGTRDLATNVTDDDVIMTAKIASRQRHGWPAGADGQPPASWAAMRLAVSAGMAKPTPMLPDCWPM